MFWDNEFTAVMQFLEIRIMKLRRKTMEAITSDFELSAIGGGGPAANRIQCTIGNTGMSCKGSLGDFVGALNEFGAWIGISLYDALH
jgi:hypothetical protein